MKIHIVKFSYGVFQGQFGFCHGTRDRKSGQCSREVWPSFRNCQYSKFPQFIKHIVQLTPTDYLLVEEVDYVRFTSTYKWNALTVTFNSIQPSISLECCLLLWYFADMRFHGSWSTVWYLSGRIPDIPVFCFKRDQIIYFRGTRRFSCICCCLCFDILHMHNLNRVLCIFEISPRSVI